GDDASATESVPVQLEGEDITVAFNPAYLSEGLNVIGGQYTRFAFTRAPKPALLTGKQELEGPQNEDYRYLVMPIRIPNYPCIFHAFRLRLIVPMSRPRLRSTPAQTF